MREYILIDKNRITDEQIKIFGNKPVSRLEFDIKPEDLFDTMNYILKDNDVVCDFFGCNETIDILHACHIKKGIVYVNASIEENILKPYPSQNALYQAFFEFKKKFKPTFTGCIDAGANPGMITHFAILGIFSMAKEAIKNKIANYEEIKLLPNLFLDMQEALKKSNQNVLELKETVKEKIRSLGMTVSEEDFNKSIDRLLLETKAYLGRSLFGSDECYYRIIAANDNPRSEHHANLVLRKAWDTIRQPAYYQHMLGKQ